MYKLEMSWSLLPAPSSVTKEHARATNHNKHFMVEI